MQINMIDILLQSIGSNQYDEIKRVCDVELGVPSQNLAIGWSSSIHRQGAKLRTEINRQSRRQSIWILGQCSLQGKARAHDARTSC